MFKILFSVTISLTMAPFAWAAKNCDGSLQSSSIQVAASISNKLQSTTDWMLRIAPEDQLQLLFEMAGKGNPLLSPSRNQTIAMQLMMRTAGSRSSEDVVKDKFRFHLLAEARMVELSMSQIPANLLESDNNFLKTLLEIEAQIDSYPIINLAMLKTVTRAISDLQYVLDESKQIQRYKSAELRSKLPDEELKKLEPVHRSPEQKAEEYHRIIQQFIKDFTPTSLQSA